MQNDVLKNNIAPWQEKGRWYHLVVKSNGTAWSIDKINSDQIFADASVVANDYIQIGRDVRIIDYKILYNDDVVSSDFSALVQVRLSPTRGELITLVYASRYTGSVDIWIFMIEK